jgi:arylsulfatase A-like enzyme
LTAVDVALSLAADTALLPLTIPCSLSRSEEAVSDRPNIVFIVSDDHGKNGVGAYGAKDVRTPNLDRLAREGLRFDSHYVMPVCMPTRAVLHTGRWGFRTGMPDNMSGGWRYPVHGPLSGGRVLSPSEITVPKLLRRAGYATALVGKYHLGLASLDDPRARAGWDHYYGNPSGTLLRYDNPTLISNGRELGDIPGNATDLYTEEALRWIDANKDRPFCLWLWHNTPHGPRWVPPKYLEPYDHLPEPMRHYYAMIAHLDDSVGRILDRLDTLGLAQNTLVVFMTDNGATPDTGGDKGETNDLGTCVPMIARWPERIRPGTATSSLTNAADLLPTFAAAAGVPLPSDRTIDGVSLLPLFADPAQEVRDFSLVYWKGRFAIRRGTLKLVTSAKEGDGKDELYDLAKDPADKANAITDPAHADALKALRSIAARHREEVKREGAGTATDEGPVRRGK